jgi:hypothetical protein
MAEATVVYKYEANCSIPFIFIRYDYNAGVPAGSEISELVELPMFAPLPNYANDPKLVLGGNCYAIRIAQIGVACLSANYDLRIFNKFGEYSDLIDSVNEVLVYKNLVKTKLDTDFGEFYLAINRDEPSTNKLYLYINNYDVDTGPIRLDVVYMPVHTAPFVR